MAALAALTLRERQVVGFACQGHFEQAHRVRAWISASTVSVLLHRAAKRLGAASRADLLAAYKASLEPNGAR